jgi:acyl-coenzyme A synthetase/AMP-(fatty) acid ligase
VPQRIEFTARLPRTPSGKLDKRRLAPRRALELS